MTGGMIVRIYLMEVSERFAAVVIYLGSDSAGMSPIYLPDITPKIHRAT